MSRELTLLLLLTILIASCGTPQPPPSRGITIEEAMASLDRQRKDAALKTLPPDERNWNALKVGMTETEVETLLGKPSHMLRNNEVYSDGKRILTAILTYVYDGGSTVRKVVLSGSGYGSETISQLLIDWTTRQGEKR